MSPRAYTPEEFSQIKFDYLIIGGGTAGLVVATRLSEDPNVTVGVLEAGPPVFDEPLVDIPGKFGQTLGTKYDWAFETVPQPGLNGRTLPWPRGKMLGGTSAMNFMVWNRAAKEDYDAWEELGNPGWSWDDLRHYFMKTESLRAPSAEAQLEFKSGHNALDHGTQGPVQTSYQPFFAETHKYWHSTMQNMQIETNSEHFGGSNVGAWTTLTSVDPETQTRSYSATAYYNPIASRKNLVVLTEALTNEIFFDDARKDGNLIATGVKFTSEGTVYIAGCSREVIVCGGSVGSPQTLERSGIGSEELLVKAGISLKVINANVGENLQEHMMTITIHELRPEVMTPDDYADAEFLKAAEELYQTTKRGMLTAIPGSFAYLPVQRFLSAKDVSALTAQAKSYSTAISHSINSRDYVQNQILERQYLPEAALGSVEYILDHSNYSPAFKSVLGKKYASMLQVLQYPYSRGSIHIDPTSPQKVIIDPRYYQGEGALDLEVMAKAQEFGASIPQNEPLNSIIVKRVYPPVLKDSDGKEEKVDWKTWLPNNTVTDWHPVGTCAMLPRDKGGVVDPTLIVYGTSNVRVVDASIFPLHISAHIQATVYAIGEKAADMIKEKWKGMGEAIMVNL